MNIRPLITGIAAFLLAACANTQPAPVVDTRAIVETLASPQYEGRSVGTPGYRKSAAFVSDQMRQLGLAPLPGYDDFYHSVPMIAASNARYAGSLAMDGRTIEEGRDYSWRVAPDTIDREIPVRLLVLGANASGPSDKFDAGLASDALILLVDRRPPGTPNPDAVNDALAQVQAAAPAGFFGIVEGLRDYLVAEGEIAVRYKLAGEDGAASPTPMLWAGDLDDLALLRWIGPTLAERLDAAPDTIDMIDTGLTAQLTRSIERAVQNRPFADPNLAGWLPSASEAIDDVIVLSAHLDHLGIVDGDVYPGADDNASGVAAILSAFSKLRTGPALDKPVMLVFFTGEERGLLGSRHFADNPPFDLSKVAAWINVDSVGRAHGDDPSFARAVLIDSARCWPAIESALENALQQQELTPVPLYDAPGFEPFDQPCDAVRDGSAGAPSDQRSLAVAGVPVALLSTGIHADYHEPTDTPDKVDYEKLDAVARALVATVRALQ